MGARLLVCTAGRVTEVGLKAGRTLIGRGPSCQIRIVDPGASREHCAIDRVDGEFRLRDLGSHNGTLVNGTAVQERKLEWGDSIQVGGVRMVFMEEKEEEADRALKLSRTRGPRTETISLRIQDLRPELVRPEPEVAEFLQALFELGNVLAKPADEETVLAGLRSLVMRRFRVVNCAILMVDAARGSVTLAVPPDPPAFDAGEIAGAVAEGQARLVRLEGAGDSLMAPIQGTGAVLGVIAADSEGLPGGFTEDHLNALGVAGRQAGLALENYRYIRGLEVERSASRNAARLVGESAALGEIRRMIEKVAPTDATVLIRGESGTGKEVVARELHARSRRARGPFVAVNCATIPEGLAESELFGHEKGAFTGATASRAGLFEQAGGGSIFLDEIGELSPAIQAKLLRILENRTFLRVGGTRERVVDARILAATHHDLKTRVEEKRFRQDLYFRLNVVEIPIPPLRERSDDIEPLAVHFLRTLGSQALGFSQGALARLRRRPWPGNARELRNAVERAAILASGNEISESDLGEETPPEAQLTLEGLEREQILRVLKMVGGNKSEAARLLGIHRSTLHERLRGMEQKC